MSLEHVFDPGVSDADEFSAEKSLRPTRLEEFIGQERTVENLRIAIDTARARGDVLDHVLFSGMPGLGKTTLSSLIAQAMGTNLRTTSGPAIEKAKDIVGQLSQLERGDVLFIDEIHRLSSEAEEYLYSAMEDFKVDIILASGPDAHSVRISVQPFTLVGATTRDGLLSAPFRSRFGILEKLELYPPEDLTEILLRSARLLNCVVARDTALYLAERCRGTPRYANRFLRRVRDIAQFRSGNRSTGDAAGPLGLTPEHVKEGLDRLGIDSNGLDRIDRRIVEILLAAQEPVGLKTIAVSVGEDERTIEDVHEPYLIQRGMLLKTPRGRRASASASELYHPSPGARLPA